MLPAIAANYFIAQFSNCSNSGYYYYRQQRYQSNFPIFLFQLLPLLRCCWRSSPAPPAGTIFTGFIRPPAAASRLLLLLRRAPRPLQRRSAAAAASYFCYFYFIIPAAAGKSSQQQFQLDLEQFQPTTTIIGFQFVSSCWLPIILFYLPGQGQAAIFFFFCC